MCLICPLVIQENVWWKSSDRRVSRHSVGGHCVHISAERQYQVLVTQIGQIDVKFLYSSCVVANNLVRMDVGDILRF